MYKIAALLSVLKVDRDADGRLNVHYLENKREINTGREKTESNHGWGPRVGGEGWIGPKF